MAKFFETLFFFGLLFLQLPPLFFILPAFNLHTLGKLILISTFFYKLIFNKDSKEILFKHKTIVSLFVLFFVSQSISILNVVSIEAFLRKYEDLLFASFAFFLLFFYLENQNHLRKILYILIFGFLANSLFQLLIYLAPIFFIQFGKIFMHPDSMNLITYKLQSSQLYFESYDEILIPIFFYFFIWAKAIPLKAFLITPIFVIGFFSFISNIRTKFLMFTFTTFCSFILFAKSLKKYFLLLLTLLLIFLYLVYKSQAVSLNFTVIERLFLEDPSRDYSTIVSRIDWWKRSVEIGMTSPLIGVGLGNYYDYLSWYKQKPFSLSILKNKVSEKIVQDPHNILFVTFVETGILGLIFFSLLIFYFIKKDFWIIKQQNKISSMFIIAFWPLFIHAFFNPSVVIKYQVLWWILRIVIEKYSLLSAFDKKRKLLFGSENVFS